MIFDAIKSSWNHSRPAFVTLTVIWIVYAGLSLAAPQPPNNPYNISEPVRYALILSIVLPVLAIWWTALSGAIAFQRYSNMIAGSPEAAGLNRIGAGLIWSTIYLYAFSLIGAAIPFLVGTTWLKPAVLLRNHLPVVIVFIAFALLYTGSSHLKAVTHFHTWTKITWLVLGLYAIFAAAVTWLFSTYYEPTITAAGVPISVLPKNVLVFTQILPYLAAWFLGLLATINITKYARKVNGILYRRALTNLVRGIWGITIFGIALQAFNFASRFLTDIALGPLLGLIYALIALYALGFVFIHLGARKLAQLEAVT